MVSQKKENYSNLINPEVNVFNQFCKVLRFSFNWYLANRQLVSASPEY